MEIRPERAHVAPQRHPEEDPLPRDPERQVRREAEFNPFTAFVFSLLRFAALGLFISAALAAGAFTIWVANGAGPVREAARATYTAEDNWFATLTQTQPVIHELNARGAPRDDLETVYFAFSDATEADRALNGDALLQTLQGQAVAVRAMGHDINPILNLLQPVSTARLAVADHYQAWVAATKPLSAQIAILLRIAPTPPERLEIYDSSPQPLRMSASDQ